LLMSPWRWPFWPWSCANGRDRSLWPL